MVPELEVPALEAEERVEYRGQLDVTKFMTERSAKVARLVSLPTRVHLSLD